MFSLLKKLVILAIFLVLVSMLLNYKVQGRSVREHLNAVYRSPLAQELLRQGKEAALGLLQKDLGKGGPPQDQITDRDRKELEELLKKESDR